MIFIKFLMAAAEVLAYFVLLPFHMVGMETKTAAVVVAVGMPMVCLVYWAWKYKKGTMRFALVVAAWTIFVLKAGILFAR